MIEILGVRNCVGTELLSLGIRHFLRRKQDSDSQDSSTFKKVKLSIRSRYLMAHYWRRMMFLSLLRCSGTFYIRRNLMPISSLITYRTTDCLTLCSVNSSVSLATCNIDSTIICCPCIRLTVLFTACLLSSFSSLFLMFFRRWSGSSLMFFTMLDTWLTDILYSLATSFMNSPRINTLWPISICSSTVSLVRV